MRTTPEDTVRCRFFAPVENALSAAANRRQCPGFSDAEFLESGIGRVIAPVQSGRDWVQRLHAWMDSRLTVSNFFQSLKSQRRLRLVEDVVGYVCRQLDTSSAVDDPLAAHAELDDFAVYASDGHYEAAATHAEHVDGKALVPGSFFTINLRTHSMSLLDVARPTRKREHDITALKRLGSTVLRMGQPAGRKVIHVYDPAAIDYMQWRRWKAKGVYIISREKANSKAEVVAHNPWDKQDPRNIGIEADDLVGVFCGVLLRRVTYRDPATGTTYTYMTNELTLPPGLIAWLYKLRWDIEKVFDEKKNRFLERKAWAISDTSRAMQAHFVCLTHNLMILFELNVQTEEDIRDEKIHRRRQQRTAALVAAIRERGETPNMMALGCTRITQRSLQFIRWLNCALFRPTPWRDGMRLLRPLMQEYLA